MYWLRGLSYCQIILCCKNQYQTVQIWDTEFSFVAHEKDTTGIIETEPGEWAKAQKLTFQKQLYLGKSFLSYNELIELIEDLKIDYIGSSYNLIYKNCNHFTSEFIEKLNLSRKLPQYINRLALSCQCCENILPKWYVQGGAIAPQHRRTDSVNLAVRRLTTKYGLTGSEKQMQSSAQNSSFFQDHEKQPGQTIQLVEGTGFGNISLGAVNLNEMQESSQQGRTLIQGQQGEQSKNIHLSLLEQQFNQEDLIERNYLEHERKLMIEQNQP